MRRSPSGWYSIPAAAWGPSLQKSRQAVAQFFKTANPEDEFFLVEFNDRPELVVPFTPDTEDIQNRLEFAQSKGKTALLDGVYMAMNQMKKARNPRKAILIISDGGDNNSRYTESEIKNAVREADVQIYGIGIFEPIGSRGRTPEEQMGPGLLSEIAELTGGRSYNVENLNELADIAAKIGIELRNQYVLYYSSTNQARDGKYRHVTRQAGAAARPSSAQGIFPPRVLCALSVVLLLSSAWLPPGFVWAQNAPPSLDRPKIPRFRVDTRLVVLPVSVLDKNGKLVTDLQQKAFKVFENGVEQPIKIFRREDVPDFAGHHHRQQRQHAREARRRWRPLRWIW